MLSCNVGNYLIERQSERHIIKLDNSCYLLIGQHKIALRTIDVCLMTVALRTFGRKLQIKILIFVYLFILSIELIYTNIYKSINVNNNTENQTKSE